MSENDAISAAKTGDSHAFTVLYEMHKPMVRSLCRNMLDDDLADDLTQDVFLHLHQHIHQYDGRSSFATWLYKMTKNKVFMYLRRINSRPKIAKWIDDETKFDIASRYDLHKDVDTRLTLQRLSDRHLPVVELRAEGYSIEDISKRSGLSMSATKSRIYQSRKRLKAALA